MQNSFVAVLIRYHTKPEATEQGVAVLRRLIETVVRQEPDCFRIRLFRDKDDPACILLYEEWASKEAYLGPHFETPHLKAFIAEAPRFFAGRPDITFWELNDELLSSHHQ